jgi:hypothetical protein
MHIGNANRLFQMAQLRRATAPAPQPGYKTYDEPCIQCGQTATLKHTDMVTETVTHWCDSDWDQWWTTTTYLPKLRAGEIRDVTELFIPSGANILEDNLDWQLENWPK